MGVTVTRVRLSAEWGALPMWVLDADGYLEDMAPEELGLSAGLAADITRWDEVFQAFYNDDDPAASSTFRDSDAESAWIESGKTLSRRIAAELSGASVEFRYHGVSYSA